MANDAQTQNRNRADDEAPRPAAPAKAAPATFTHTWTEPKPKAGGFFWGTGRRKSAIARVRIREGTGQIKINDKDFDKYFPVDHQQRTVVAPLDATDTRKRVDVFVNASGGGTTGQADAIALGIARALVTASKEYQGALRLGEYLTRDDRKVERKKYGRAGARRSFQFSKR